MPKFIDRDKALSFPLANGKYDHENANWHFIYGLETYKEWLERLPTLSPDEVRGVGEWIKASTFERCPSCGYETGKRGTASKYCPDCGMRLRMKGAEDGTTDNT